MNKLTNSSLKRILVSITLEDHCGLGGITEKQRKNLLKIPKGVYVCVKKKFQFQFGILETM